LNYEAFIEFQAKIEKISILLVFDFLSFKNIFTIKNKSNCSVEKYKNTQLFGISFELEDAT
jgi:hypothetical protein